MKLYYSPGACSLSPHIALHEAGLAHEIERVNLKDKLTETGEDYKTINPKGGVPALELDNGEILTEGPAIVQYIADLAPQSGLAPKAGTMELYRLQEMLNFITSELHKGFSPLFNPNLSDDAKAVLRGVLESKFRYIDEVLQENGPYLFGDQFTVADAYLYTVTGWAAGQKVNLNDCRALAIFIEAVEQRDSVKAARKMEQALKAA